MSKISDDEKNGVGEAVAWQRKLRKRGTFDWSDWKECTKAQADHAEAYGHPMDFKEVEAIARPLYARPAPIEITEAAERAFKDGLAYGSNVRNADPDIAWGHSAIRAALQGETK